MSLIPGEGMTAAAAVEAVLAAVETEEEGGVAATLLLRAGLVRECTECEALHRSAGSFCATCRRPFLLNMPAEARWFIAYENEGGPGVWLLRNGVGHDTLIFAHNNELREQDVQEAKEWAAGVLKADYNTSVFDWSKSWEGPGTPDPDYPDYWIAATNTDE